MKQNAIIYIRVSSAEQVTNFSLQTQEKACRKYCEDNGLTVNRVFCDAGESAKSTDRTQFKKMLAYCADKETCVRTLVVYNTSRFSRNVSDFYQTSALLAARNITLRSVTEPAGEGPEGFLISGMMALMADFDNRLKAQRTVVGMKAAISSGRWTHGAPLGYLIGAKGAGVTTPSLIHDGHCAHLVRLAFEQVAHGLLSQKEVLTQVTAAGLRSKTGKQLSAQSFHKMLRRPIYAGRICVKNLGENLHADFEPLVLPEIFDRVQDVLAGRRPRLRPRVQDHDFPLRVFVRCGDCGTPLTGSWSTGRNGKKYAHYACRKKTCRGVKARKDDLEGEFIDYLRNLLPKPELVRLFREVVLDVWKQKEAANLANAGALQEQVDGINQKIEQLEEAYVYRTRAIDSQTYTRLLDKLRQDLLLAHAEQRKTAADGFNIEALLSFAEHLLTNASEMWLKADLTQRQRLQDVLFPAGVTYLSGKFGTAVTCPLFNVFQHIEGENDKLASPRGFEPGKRR
jgi:DNA invertase Pin-like site-specific DNA recombinase